jgi:hypothetical protein
MEATCGDLELIGEVVSHHGTLDLDRIASVLAGDLNLTEKREPVVEVGDHMAYHLAHSETLLQVPIGDQVVEISEGHGPDEGIVDGRLPGGPCCG